MPGSQNRRQWTSSSCASIMVLTQKQTGDGGSTQRWDPGCWPLNNLLLTVIELVLEANRWKPQTRTEGFRGEWNALEITLPELDEIPPSYARSVSGQPGGVLLALLIKYRLCKKGLDPRDTFYKQNDGKRLRWTEELSKIWCVIGSLSSFWNRSDDD